MSSTIAQTQLDAYVRIRGENLPINLTATGGIKCIDCGQNYPSSEMQKHLTTHINPKFVKSSPMQKNQQRNKMNLKNFMQDPQKLQQIWVKSFLPGDLPQVQKERKVAAKLQGQHSLLKNLIFLGLNQIRPMNSDLVSNIGETSETVQSQIQLNIKKNIKINKVTNPIQKKQLHVYMNERGINSNYDTVISKSKLGKEQQTQASDGYSVMQAPVSTTVIREDGPQTPRKQNRQTYNIKSGLKNPGNPLYISTISKPSGLGLTQIKQYSPKSTILDGSSEKPDHHDHSHECSSCKGFYCSLCKSSVPPIYRPVPDQQGKYHFHPQQNEKAIQFYKNHYYPRQDKNVCTGCQKKIELSRMASSRMESSRRQQPSPWN